MKAIVVTLACLFLSAAAWSQTTWYVDAANTSGPWNGTPQNPFRCIQDGIDAAANLDTVLVMAGTYSGDRNRDLDFSGKAITVRSNSGAAATIVDCGGSASDWHRGFIFQSGEGGASLLEGFTIINGYQGVPAPTAQPPIGCGGGILCKNGSSPHVTDCVIRDCVAENCGGGMFVFGNFSQIEDCVFEDNRVLYIAITGGLGGGLSVYQKSDSEIRRCSFFRNHTERSGGGISVNFQSSPYIDDCLIRDNVADDNGGGIISGGSVLWEKCSPEITDCDVAGNSAAGLGGGIACNGGDPVIRDCEISGNKGGQGGGIDLYRGGFMVDGNEISGNEAPLGGGVSVSTWTGTTGTIRNSVISGNKGYSGGGIKIWGIGSIVINQCVIAFNVADHQGGGVYQQSDHTFQNCTYYGNQAGHDGGALTAEFGSTPTLVNCILWNNAPREIQAQAGSTVTASYCCIRGGYPGTGNISAAPILADPFLGDFHLTFSSPCRNVADGTAPDLLPTDFEGDRRSAQGAVDMGADEFDHHLYYLGAATPGGQIAVRAVGPPGMPVSLSLGKGVLNSPLPTQHGYLYLTLPLLANWNLGAIPANGVLFSPVTVPPGWAAGEEHPLQALVGAWGGPFTRLTNLMMVEVE